jgi:hypothetical protein
MRKLCLASLLLLAATAFGETWSTIDNKALTCTSDEFQGTLGQMDKAELCLAGAKGQGSRVNYALWRGDSNKGCYVCLITKRGPSSTWKYSDVKGAVSFASNVIPTPTPAPPTPAPAPPIEIGGITFEVWDGAFTIKALNKSVAAGSSPDVTTNLSFVPVHKPNPGCHNLGDLTVRVRPQSSKGDWAIYSSADATQKQVATPVTDKNPLTVLAHDITALANTTSAASPNPHYDSIPLKIIRSYEKAPAAAGGGKGGFVIRMKLTNTASDPVEIGALGLAMPSAGMQKDIKDSVWSDPHIGGQHGYVEWVRCVVDEQTLLAVPLVDPAPSRTAAQTTAPSTATTASVLDLSRFESWRPILENSCGNDVWEMVAVSMAWTEEWAANQQFPYMYMSEALNKTGTWPHPKSPWPAWHANDTIPVTDFAGIAQPWNDPTSVVLKPGETANFAVQLLLAPRDPRTRDTALATAGKAVMRAVPGYVLSSSMTTAKLYVGCPAGTKVVAVTVSNSTVLTATLVATEPPSTSSDTASTTSSTTSSSSASARSTSSSSQEAIISVRASVRGRASVSVKFDDGTTAVAHYTTIPDFAEQVLPMK